MNTLVLSILFAQASGQFHLPPNLLSSMCYIESKHNTQAFHKNDGDGNSIGVCQIKLKTAKYLGFKGTEKQLMNPETNIHYAAKYLAKHLNKYHNTTKAIIAYNVGHASRNIASTSYSTKVLNQWEIQNNVQWRSANSCSIGHQE